MPRTVPLATLSAPQKLAPSGLSGIGDVNKGLSVGAALSLMPEQPRSPLWDRKLHSVGVATGGTSTPFPRMS